MLSKILIALGMVITCVVFLNVVCRYLFLTTLPWAEELARFMFIWLTFIGSVIANDQLQHMRLDIVVNKFPEKVSRIIVGVSYILVLVLLVILIKGGVDYTVSQWDWCSSALGVRHGIVYIIAPISFTIMAIQYVFRLVQMVCEIIKGGK